MGIPPKRPTPIPRALTHRDERTTKAPPAGLIERVAGMSGGVPSPMINEEKTDPHATEFEKVQHRASRAAENSLAAATSSRGALEQISEVRKELREDIRAVSSRLDDALKEFAGTRVEVAEVTGVLGQLVKAVDLATQTMAEHKTIRLTAEVEVDKEVRLDVVQAKRWTREQIGKVIAAVIAGGGITVLIGALAGRC